MQHHLETVKHVVDWAAVIVMVGAVASWLPSLAALFTIAWTGLRIYETRTVQGWLGRGRRPR